MRRYPYGPEAWLLDDVEEPAGLAAGIAALEHPDVTDVVPCESTVVVRCTRGSWAEVGNHLDTVTPLTAGPVAEDTVVIDVVYDGEDLETVAEANGRPVEGVIPRHPASEGDRVLAGGGKFLAPSSPRGRSRSPRATPPSTRERHPGGGICWAGRPQPCGTLLRTHRRSCVPGAPCGSAGSGRDS
jgi:allophanate hydrolase subunit 1